MLDVTICIGSSCHLRGSRDVVQIFQRLVANHHLEDRVNLKGSFCMGECTGSVCVKIGEKTFKVTPSEVEALFEKEVLGVLKE